jgi:hypothetical protein
MPGPRHHFRVRPIALMAMGAMLLAVGGASTSASAATGPGRRTPMSRTECCCPSLPVGGCCCCEPAAASAPSQATTRATASVRTISRTRPQVDATGSRNTCQCRSGDPVAPLRRPDRPARDRTQESVGTAVAVELFQEPITPVARHPRNVPTAGFSRAPTYLRTSRLLI